MDGWTQGVGKDRDGDTQEWTDYICSAGQYY